jgi:hypothetical protein
MFNVSAQRKTFEFFKNKIFGNNPREYRRLYHSNNNLKVNKQSFKLK